LGAIGGEDAFLGLLTAAEHAEACACERVTGALPAMFGRSGASARPYLSERLRDHGRSSRFRATMAHCLAATAMGELQHASAVLAELETVRSEAEDVGLKAAIGRVLEDLQGTAPRDVPPAQGDPLAWYPAANGPSRDAAPALSDTTDVDVELAAGESQPEPVAQVIRQGPKIGRNAPCSCGSGKKYKKCCLEVDAALGPLNGLM
jgi:hypothetical protein